MRGRELEHSEVLAYLAALPDVTDKATASNPLEEPDERAHERRAHTPLVRITMPPPRDESEDDLLDDLDDEDDEDDEDDDDDEDDLE